MVVTPPPDDYTDWLVWARMNIDYLPPYNMHFVSAGGGPVPVPDSDPPEVQQRFRRRYYDGFSYANLSPDGYTNPPNPNRRTAT